jgi:hypothetical protein
MDLSGKTFVCQQSSDCTSGFTCIAGVCLTGTADAGGVTDGGPGDSGATDSGPADGGFLDSGADGGVDAGVDGGDCCTNPAWCPPLTRLLNNPVQSSVVAIAVDATSVYWTAGTAVWKAQLDGSNALALASGPVPAQRLVVDSDTAFWQGTFLQGVDGGTFSVPLDGGPITPLQYPRDFAAGLSVVAGTLYWVGQNTLWVLPLDGGALTTLYPATFGDCRDLVADGTGAYWGSYEVSGSAGKIAAARLDGSGNLVLAPGQNVNALAIDPMFVYWLSTQYDAGNYGPYTLARTDKSLGPAIQMLFSNPVGRPLALVVDGAAAYWTLNPSAGPGAVWMQPLDGGAASCLASGLSSPFHMAQDARFLYWTDDADNALYRVAKP